MNKRYISQVNDVSVNKYNKCYIFQANDIFKSDL